MALGVGGPVAGCLSENKATNPDTNTAAHSDTEMCTTGENTSLKGFSVGETTSDTNPHGLTVHNDADSSRTVIVHITDTETNETLRDRSCSLGGGKDISGELGGSAEYRVTVTVPDSGMEHDTMVDYFDTCNDYGTTVTISPDGTITSETVRTERECDPK